MNYFILNNNFHMNDAIRHIRKHSIIDVCFICIPHAIDKSKIIKSGIPTIFFDSPLTKRMGTLNIFSLLRVIYDLRCKLHPNADDKIFFYTEYELLNHAVIKRFKYFGATTILIEENGLASYAINKMASSSSRKNLILSRPKWLLPTIIFSGVKADCVISDREVFPLLKDSYIDKIAYYSNIKVNRKIPVFLVRSDEESVAKKNLEFSGSALFLSQDLYNFYMTKNEYFEYLEKVIYHLKKELGYNEIIFKLHPREVGNEIEREVKERFSELKFINSKDPVEDVIDNLKPSLIVSFASSALIPLSRQGWKVLFTISYTNIECSPILKEIQKSIKQFNDNDIEDKCLLSLFDL
ncbi:polysialyltransferase family glycosyltransferase [Vibrio parahaemolyticus]|uniref:polysialyltransferase family glycosyltransferase n=1 Tax=Vibrio parahaemolyticus TaxID=670 RepID=UPI0011246341|nr:polysialyltransferase family glycosyltransferase [Vibrio parahaemolyticus]MCS0092556.1 alpha-2,8-polysialyltransferase family protein [Vibrio parahaemolyticus]TPA08026.1 hypothetical protein DXE03_14430 [Vibrio parahaemolyticus]HCG8030243.1 hypothetical protein [Vibrio parahaemolyticus]HCG8051153.1 hypothetical protein [Vibrio parahaemolyticus]HCG8066564.1 hypothetical protein [Vibrio parahaemolyticus]